MDHVRKLKNRIATLHTLALVVSNILFYWYFNKETILAYLFGEMLGVAIIMSMYITIENIMTNAALAIAMQRLDINAKEVLANLRDIHGENKTTANEAANLIIHQNNIISNMMTRAIGG